MDGYDAATYGDRFAEVYDDWYGDLTDAEACIDLIAELAARSPAGHGAEGHTGDDTNDDDHDTGAVLELGVGTGRLAIPLAGRGLRVVGVDASPAMLAHLAAKPGGEQVEAVLGDMAAPPLGDRRFAVVFVAYNTLFNLIDPADQQRCLADAATRLSPAGSVVVEAFVPEPDRVADAVTARTITADRVVLSVSRTDAGGQQALGQYVDITEAGIRLRPWHIRWSTPAQLDDMAATAGLVVADRWADWHLTPFHADAPAHVTRYVRA